jgi:hypothetical protein
MRRAHRLMMVAGAACVLVACNLIAGFESEYTVSSDSGTTSETSNPDSPVAPDAPVNPDGGPDGPGDTGIDVRPFSCNDEDASSLGFCQDFEGVGAATAPYGFDVVNNTSVDASFAVTSGPTSKFLRVTMHNPSAANGILAQLSAQVIPNNPRAWVHYEVDLDFRVPATTLDYAALSILTFPSGGSDREHGISVEGATAKNLGRLQPQGSNTLKNDPANWFHLHLTMDQEDSGTTYRRRIRLTSPTATTDCDDQPGLTSPTFGGTDIRIGAFNSSPNSGSITVEFDNVVVRRW